MGRDRDPVRPVLTPPGPRAAIWLLRLLAVAALATEQAGVPLAGATLLLAGSAALVRRPRTLGLLALLAAIAFLYRDALNLRGPGSSALESGPGVEASFRAVESELVDLSARASRRLQPKMDAPAAFEALAGARRPRRTALTLIEGNDAIAWSGRSSVPAAAAARAGLSLLPEDAGGVLVLVTPLPGGRALAAETSLGRWLGALGADARLSAAHPGDAESLFRRGSDTGPHPAATVRLLLRGSGGGPVALLTFRSQPTTPGGSSAAARLAPAALLLLLAGLALEAARSAARTGRALETTVAVSLVAAARLAAQARSLAWPATLFDHAALAVVSPLDLFSSPGDLLESGIAAAAIAGTIVLAIRRRSLGREAMAGSRPLLLRLALTGAATAFGVYHLMDLLRRVIENSDLDLATFALVPPDPVRLAALVGLFLLAVSIVGLGAQLVRASLAGSSPLASLAWAALSFLPALLLAAGRYATKTFIPLPSALALVAAPALLGALSAGRGPLRSPLRATMASLVLSGLLLQSAAQADTARSLRTFIRSDLVDRVRRQDVIVRQVLAYVVRDLDGRWGVELAGRLPEDIAYRVWRTRLASGRYRAAVDVLPTAGPTARFARGLPLPPEVRPVSPGTTMLQDVLFQGRRLRVLAAAAELPDGTQVVVRIAEDPQGLPFFRDVHHPLEALVPESAPQAELLDRAGAALVVSDERGRVVHATVHPLPAVPPAVVQRAQSSDEPFDWVLALDGRTGDALSFGAGERTVTVLVPRPPAVERVADLLHVVLFALVHAAALALLLGLLSREARAALPGRSWVRRSHYRKTLLGFTAGAVLPALAFSLYLRSTSEAEALREIRDRGIRALEFARRILEEFAAAEPEARIDDSALIWASQTIGYDLALYRGSRLEATSMRELFREGLLPPRPDAKAYRAIRLEGAPTYAALRRVGGPVSLQVSAPVGDEGLLTLLSVAHESDVERAAESRNHVLFVATAGLLLLAALLARLVARRAAEPVRALTHAAERVGRGDLGVRIASSRHDEVRRLIDAFNEMAAQLESQRGELRARTAYLARLLENAPIGVLSIDSRGTVTTVNPAARALLGTEVLAGSPLGELRGDPELRPLLHRLSGPPPREREELEVKTAPDRTLRAVVLPLPLDDGAPALAAAAGAATPLGRMVLLEDITDIVRSKKLDAWAEMARRVAHEVKNPLTPIQLAAEHLRRVHADGRPGFGRVLEECVSTILKQVSDLRRIAREFSAYASGPAPIHTVPTDVAAWLEEVLQPYRLAPRAGITIVVESRPGIGEARLDPGRIQRALLNLVENGLQAMPRGGSLTVRAERTNGELRIEVEDTGVGFPEELRGRLFEPYFSTKDVGTGLGLANAKQAVEDHGGRIELESEPGKGTRVTLVLPVSGP